VEFDFKRTVEKSSSGKSPSFKGIVDLKSGVSSTRKVSAYDTGGSSSREITSFEPTNYSARSLDDGAGFQAELDEDLTGARFVSSDDSTKTDGLLQEMGFETDKNGDSISEGLEKPPIDGEAGGIYERIKEIQAELESLEGELGEKSTSSQIAGLKDLRRRILEKRHWLTIDPVEKSEQFAEMLRGMEGFYEKIRTARENQQSSDSTPDRQAGAAQESIPVMKSPEASPIAEEILSFSGWSPPGFPAGPISFAIGAYSKYEMLAARLGRKGDQTMSVGFSNLISEPEPEPAPKPEPTPEPEPTPTPKPSGGHAKKPDSGEKPSSGVSEKPKNGDKPDAGKDKKGKDREKEARKDERKREAGALKQERQTKKDEDEIKKQERVMDLTSEIKEISFKINNIEGEINELEGNLEALIAEHNDDPDFDPGPLRDKIEQKQIEIEMFRFKIEMRKREMEGLKGKQIDDDDYNFDAIDYTIAREEITKETIEDTHYKAREAVEQNIEFMDDFPDDKRKADITSDFTRKEKELEAAGILSKQQELIEEKYFDRE